MKRFLGSVGDRELAWIILAFAGLIVWSSWGLVS